jgi:hypothetical protein
LVISPGPCTPNEAGISIEVIKNFAGKIPILNIALGTDHLTWRGVGYGFLFRSEICFRTTQELEYLFFLSRKAGIFVSAFTYKIFINIQYFFYWKKHSRGVIYIFFKGFLKGHPLMKKN